jgi:hypothetical protein
MSQRVKSMLVGLAAGALLGAAFAWVASEGVDEEGGERLGLAALGPGDYFQLGISILTLARQFGSMVKKT